MYAKHVNLVDADASSGKPAQTPWITFRGHSRSRILVSLKSRRGTVYHCNNVGFRVENFEGNVWASSFSRTPTVIRHPLSREPLRIFTHTSYFCRNCNHWLTFYHRQYHYGLSSFNFFSGRLHKTTFFEECVSAVQSHPRYESKARMPMTISPS